MGRYDRKHGSHHKAAVVHAITEQGMTADQVVTLAAAGQLKAPGRRDRLAPFTIAASTVRQYVWLHRRKERRAASNGGHDREDDGPLPGEVTVPVERPADKSAQERDILRALLGHDDPATAGESAPPAKPDQPEGILQRLLREVQEREAREAQGDAETPEEPGADP